MEVNLTKRVDTPAGRRFCPIVVGPNGRIETGWIEIDGQQKKHPGGTYYLDWTEAGTRKRMAGRSLL